MEQAIARLTEWGSHSEPVMVIVEYLKQNLTPGLAASVMREGKSAEKLWDYIVQQAAKALKMKYGCLGQDKVFAYAEAYLNHTDEQKASQKPVSTKPVQSHAAVTSTKSTPAVLSQKKRSPTKASRLSTGSINQKPSPQAQPADQLSLF